MTMTKLQEFKFAIRNRVQILETYMTKFQKQLNNCKTTKETDQLIRSNTIPKFDHMYNLRYFVHLPEMDVKTRLQLARYVKIYGFFKYINSHYVGDGIIQYHVFDNKIKKGWGVLGYKVTSDKAYRIKTMKTATVKAQLTNFVNDYKDFDNALSSLEEHGYYNDGNTRATMKHRDINKLTIANDNITSFKKWSIKACNLFFAADFNYDKTGFVRAIYE